MTYIELDDMLLWLGTGDMIRENSLLAFTRGESNTGSEISNRDWRLPHNIFWKVSSSSESPIKSISIGKRECKFFQSKKIGSVATTNWSRGCGFGYGVWINHYNKSSDGLLKNISHSPIVSYSCVESLFAAVCLHIVDDGSMKRRGAADPPRADQDHADPDLLQGLDHLLVEHDCQVDTINL